MYRNLSKVMFVALLLGLLAACVQPAPSSSQPAASQPAEKPADANAASSHAPLLKASRPTLPHSR